MLQHEADINKIFVYSLSFNDKIDIVQMCLINVPSKLKGILRLLKIGRKRGIINI